MGELVFYPMPLILYLVYHSLNVFTDIKYRITKNLWHLLFIIIGLVYCVIVDVKLLYSSLIAMAIALVFGLILERIKLSSPGDTKMFVVTVIYLGCMLPHHGYIRIALAVVLFHLFLVAVYTYFMLIKELGLKMTLKNQFNDWKALLIPGMPLSNVKVFDHFPGAVTIMLGGLVYYTAIVILETNGIGY